jgi:integrase
LNGAATGFKRIRLGEIVADNRRTPGNKKARRSLRGTNLDIDPRNGIYLWRMTHPLTGKRMKRSTGTRHLKTALARARAFEEELEREQAGLSKYEGYKRPITPFIEQFLDSTNGSDERRLRLRKELERAFELVGLRRLADLENFMALEEKLLKLEAEDRGGFKRSTLARCFQEPLKQFSNYLASRRILPFDHLASWRPIKSEAASRQRRALHPDEVARALAASDYLDGRCGHRRQYPTRSIWTTLLISAPRISALTGLDVGDFDRGDGRLLFKGGNEIKAVGSGALDSRTAGELAQYLGERAEGPLFLSPMGSRVDSQRSLDRWRAALSLAFVDMDWPADRPRDEELMYLVHLSLVAGRLRASLGGPGTGANRPGEEKLAARRSMAQAVAETRDELREGWERRMQGTDQHCLRKTHRTWALAAGVPEILIDRQLGHTSPAGEAAQRAAWSLIGRRHYTDMGFLALDARRSAEAVREMLDRAEEEYRDVVASSNTALRRPDSSQPEAKKA